MAAYSAQGTTLKQNGTAVAQLTSIKPNAMTRAKLDTTDLDATWETSIAGIPRGGEIEFEGNYSAAVASHAALWTSFGTGAIDTWAITLTDSGAAIFSVSGWIMSLQVGEAKTDGIQKFTCKIQTTSTVTLTP